MAAAGIYTLNAWNAGSGIRYKVIAPFLAHFAELHGERMCSKSSD